jgi:hypothetical protein
MHWQVVELMIDTLATHSASSIYEGKNQKYLNVINFLIEGRIRVILDPY